MCPFNKNPDIKKKLKSLEAGKGTNLRIGHVLYKGEVWEEKRGIEKRSKPRAWEDPEGAEKKEGMIEEDMKKEGTLKGR